MRREKETSYVKKRIEKVLKNVITNKKKRAL
jgi:hypothetical protein